MERSLIYALLFLFLTPNWPQTSAQDSLTRVNADYDESSCICGLNSKILDQLESIVRQSSLSCGNTHQVETLDLDPKHSSHLRPLEITKDTTISENTVHDTNGQQPATSPPPSTDQQAKDASKNVDTQPNQPQVTNLAASNTLKPEVSKNDNINTAGGGTTTMEKLTLEIMRLEKQIHELQQEASSGGENGPKGPGPQNDDAQNGGGKLIETQKQGQDATPNKGSSTTSHVVYSGYLQGLSINPTNTHNEALMKLNQSTEIKPQDMQSAIQSTVPNVVSNIFTNIQNLTELGMGDINMTPSSLIVKGNTTDEIRASGEEIFRVWIEHQIQTLHLTASMANQIRKSSMNLFRRIVKQYLERVQRMGGSLEDNMRKATQAALNNTQSLTGFLLKNYINFASGLMQIIGEQVSRVGKHLDSTGESIAHISLNPFDIVSNVMESLPNPSEYSKYFREFGKQLMGQFTGQQQQQDDSKVNEGSQEAGGNHSGSSAGEKPKGLLSKTMGALTKTIGSWLG